MRRSVAISLITMALVGIASAAGYNAYSSYVVGRTMRWAMEADASRTLPVLELGCAADQSTYARALAACRESVETRLRLRRQVAMLDARDFEIVQVRILRLFDLEDRAVEKKLQFLRALINLHCAQERFAPLIASDAAPGPSRPARPEYEEARASFVAKAERAQEAARSYLEAYHEAFRFSGKLRGMANTAGLRFPDAFGALEEANRRQVREVLDAIGPAASEPEPVRITDLLLPGIDRAPREGPGPAWGR